VNKIPIQWRLLIPILALLAAGLGCGLPNPVNLLSKSATPTLRATIRAVTATIRPSTAPATATRPSGLSTTATRPAGAGVTATPPRGGITLGEEVLFSEGGFTYRKIPNYKVTTGKPADLTLTAPNADGDLGPSIILSSSLVKTGTTNDGLLQEYKRQLTEFKFSESKPVKVGGFPGLSADLTTTRQGRTLSGRIVVSMLTTSMRFVMLGGAPREIWDAETGALFDSELAAIKFSGPNPPLPTPKP
jgi:hypothetical protein